jgi:hypothetical protein
MSWGGRFHVKSDPLDRVKSDPLGSGLRNPQIPWATCNLIRLDRFPGLLGGRGRERAFSSAAGRRPGAMRRPQAVTIIRPGACRGLRWWVCSSVSVGRGKPVLTRGPARSREKPEAARGAQPKASTERVRISAQRPLIEEAGTCGRFEGCSGRSAPTSCRRSMRRGGQARRARRVA